MRPFRILVRFLPGAGSSGGEDHLHILALLEQISESADIEDQQRRR
jgi:hypothetical protein